MKYYACLFFFFLIGFSGYSQESKVVSIYRVKSFLSSALKFKLDINGREYELKNGDKLELSLSSDSLHINLLNKRLGKTSRQVHDVLDNENYILIYPKAGDGFKGIRDSVIIQSVCKECYISTLNETKKR